MPAGGGASGNPPRGPPCRRWATIQERSVERLCAVGVRELARSLLALEQPIALQFGHVGLLLGELTLTVGKLALPHIELGAETIVVRRVEPLQGLRSARRRQRW